METWFNAFGVHSVVTGQDGKKPYPPYGVRCGRSPIVARFGRISVPPAFSIFEIGFRFSPWCANSHAATRFSWLTLGRLDRHGKPPRRAAAWIGAGSACGIRWNGHGLRIWQG